MFFKRNSNFDKFNDGDCVLNVPSNLDNSKYEHKLTVAGTPEFSVADGKKCLVFDGSTDYLKFESKEFARLGTDDFTFLFTARNHNTSVNNRSIFSTWHSGNADMKMFVVCFHSGAYYITIRDGSLSLYSQPSGEILNQTWHTMALVRSGDTIQWYDNGVPKNSKTFTGSLGVSNEDTPIIGNYYTNFSSAYAWDGEIASIKIIKGRALSHSEIQTEVTIPKEYNACSLDLRFNGDISKGSSASDHAVEFIGQPEIITSSKAVSEVISFPDGGTAKLSVPVSPDFSFGTGAYTIQAWVKLENHAGKYPCIVTKNYYQTGQKGWKLRIGASKEVGFIQTDNGTLYQLTGNVTLNENQWYHVAVSANGTGTGQAGMYINGQLAATGTLSMDDNEDYMLDIGNDSLSANKEFYGKIDCLQIIKGRSLYNAEFTPPSRNSDHHIDNSTVLFLSYEVNSIRDKTGRHPVFYAGQTTADTISGANVVTMPFNGSNQYLKVVHSDDLVFGTDVFTVDFWIKPNSLGVNEYICANRSDSEDGWFGVYAGLGGGGGFVQAFMEDGARSASKRSDEGVLSGLTWAHIALIRDADNLHIAVNGTIWTSAGAGTLSVDGINHRIGCIDRYNDGGSNFFKGAVSHYRVTASALWNSNFTPPVPGTNDYDLTPYTKLLIKFDDVPKDETGEHEVEAVNFDMSGNIWDAPGYFDLSTGGDYLKVTNGGSFDPSRDFSFTCWLNFPALSNSPMIFSIYKDGNDHFDFRYNNGVNAWDSFFYKSGTLYQVYKADSVETDRWYFLVMTFSGTNVKIYRNAVKVMDMNHVTTPPPNLTSTSLQLGAQAGTSGQIRLAKPKWFKRTLSIGEIEMILREGL